MLAQGQAGGAVVRQHVLAHRRRGQDDRVLVRDCRAAAGAAVRCRPPPSARHGDGRPATAARRLRPARARFFVQRGTQAEVAHIGERVLRARGHDRACPRFRQSGHLAQAEPHRGLSAVVDAASWMPAFQRVVPVADGDVDRMHVDADTPELPAARVLHDLAGRVEAHRLRVEQGAGERGRLVALQPAADVDQLGERGRVALREAVGTEALDLLEDLVDEFR
jgi:hypothetical protein